ncbi:MAG: hypothetical protein ACOCWO_00710 [Candidatus Muiribacteriaceae bacterium]
MKFRLIFLFLIFSTCFTVLSLDISPEAEEYYIKSMSMLGRNSEDKAAEFFEKAVFEDARVLVFDDKGLLDKVTNKYVKKAMDTEKSENLFRLAYLMRIRGDHKQALYFYNLFLEKGSDDRELVNRARKRVYELSYISDVLDKKKKQANPDTVIESSSAKDTEEVSAESEESKDSADEEKKERLERLISSQENEVDKLRGQYDLWFSLTYGDHKYKKEEYHSNLMYYYERKLKEAEKKLEDMKSKL